MFGHEAAQEYRTEGEWVENLKVTTPQRAQETQGHSYRNASAGKIRAADHEG